MPVCQVNDININYQIYGNGFPLVLIHPFSASLEFWAPQVEKLSSKYQIIAYDVRGHGLSSSPAGEENYTLDIMVEAIEVAKPDLIAFAGDAFKTRSPNPTLVNLFAERMQRLGDIAPVIAVLGNHDRQMRGKRHSIELLSELKCKHGICVLGDVAYVKYDFAHIATLPWTYSNWEDAYDHVDRMASSLPDDLPGILIGQ